MGEDTQTEEETTLTPQEELFCAAYANPESKTYGNGTGSARAAKYVQPHNAAWKLRKRPRIIARLVELHEVAAAGLGKVMADIEHTRLAALKKGDLATAARCSELQGKRLGAFVDVHVLDADARREYSEAEQIEAGRLARLLLTHPPTEAEYAADLAAVRAGASSETPPVIEGALALPSSDVDAPGPAATWLAEQGAGGGNGNGRGEGDAVTGERP